MILSYGGFYLSLNKNIQNICSLEYLVEAVESEIYGQEMHPNIYNKAAAYIFYIIKDHIFYDGNKRTGTQTAISFLEANGIYLNEDIESDDMVQLAISVSESEMSLEEIEEWFRSNTTT